MGNVCVCACERFIENFHFIRRLRICWTLILKRTHFDDQINMNLKLVVDNLLQSSFMIINIVLR